MLITQSTDLFALKFKIVLYKYFAIYQFSVKKLLYLYYEIVHRFHSIIRIGRLVSLIDLSRHKKNITTRI